MNKNLIEEIKNQYPLLQQWSDHYAYEIYKRIAEEQIIKEFLYTTEAEKLSRFLINEFRNQIYINYNKKGDEIINIEITFRDSLETYLKQVNDFMEKHGWFPSYIKNEGKYSAVVSKYFDYKNITIIYEGKYNKEISVDRYLYHLTPDIIYPKIKLNGLTPKSKSKISNHPERIYLLLPTTEDDYEIVAYRLWEEIKSKQLKQTIEDYYLLQIDTSKLPKHKFFDDPNFYIGEEAVWTYQNIPPNAINIINLIKVNPEPIIHEGYKIADKRRNKFKEKFQNKNKINEHK